MAGLHPLEYDPDAPTQFSMAAGTYSGESAIAAGLFHNPNKDVLLSVGFRSAAVRRQLMSALPSALAEARNQKPVK